jgi:hypothetical protein
VAGTTNGKSYIITSQTGKTEKLSGVSEDVAINW